MKIRLSGPVNLQCLDRAIPFSFVAFDVVTNDEEKAKVASLETIREHGLLALQGLSNGKTLRRLKQDLEDGGAIVLPGSPPFYLLKDSVKL